MLSFLSKLFGSNDRAIAQFHPIVNRINRLETSISALSDEELRLKTVEFRTRISKGATLDKLLPEAFAVVREAARRIIGERHFDVQLLGGIALHRGMIAEMKTGEGKTLTSTLAIYLNALAGKGVHVVTVNDYLAKRDANWMGSVYHSLGLSTACILQQGFSFRYEPNRMDSDEVSVETENLIPISRREAYAADITYGTNNEFGFDYLRDNMVDRVDRMVQRELFFAIVDEVDSILIDEARTPLIISAPDAESTKLYQQFAKIVPHLVKNEDYAVDEKMKSVSIMESGISKVEQSLGIGNIYESGRVQYVHHLEQSLKAEVIFKRDRDYVVREGEVIIVDDFTGRLMVGRRYSDGLHQAIEAKEGVAVQKESRTLATITFQNYFRLYGKLSGMTGTAMTSAEEFRKVYELDTIEIPTNRLAIRKDFSDIIYKTETEKFRAIVQKICELRESGQPVLVGTVAIEKSEYISSLLLSEGVRHEVLNAKNHEREAAIIARAGQKGSVTIATNMAGRGTDIKLGEGVRDLGGLFILGTERHEARRIDNQLRGRAGRQGDPGISQFYVSLEDELMRRFGGDKLKNIMTRLRLPDDEPIQNRLISRTIESAQNKIEGYNFDIRKHVLDYDDVMNKQREVVYRRRRAVLSAGDMRNETLKLFGEESEKILSAHAVSESSGWDIDAILKDIGAIFPPNERKLRVKLEEILRNTALEQPQKISAAIEFFLGEIKVEYGKKENEFGKDIWESLQQALFLRTLDSLWMNHLDEIDYLRQGIGLRGYGQRDPLVEYKREAFNMFVVLLESIRTTYLSTVFKVSIAPAPQPETLPNNVEYRGAEEISSFAATESAQEKGRKAPSSPLRGGLQVGRNDPCPCGSGKKYKKCHGK